MAQLLPHSPPLQLTDILQEMRDEVQQDHERKLEQLRDEHRRELNAIREKYQDEVIGRRYNTQQIITCLI